MRVICAGGRDYKDEDTLYTYMSNLHECFGFTELVSGGCPTGADYFGEKWAKERGVAVKVFPADWGRYGKAAGPMRNEDMAIYADMCVLFPGGKGTQSMRASARLFCTHIIDIGRINES